MGYNSGNNEDNRRPGGGGGGRFTKDWIGVTTPAGLSVAAGPGNNGNGNSTGAETGTRPARGGTPGSGPFLDSRDDNDFFGTRPVVDGGQLIGLIRGELPSLWAGYGGGGGGWGRFQRGRGGGG